MTIHFETPDEAINLMEVIKDIAIADKDIAQRSEISDIYNQAQEFIKKAVLSKAK